MIRRTRKIVFNILAFLVAGILLYLALKDVDFRAMGAALGSANYWWLVPFLGVTLLSHLLRAYRWKLQLEALPDRENESPRHVSLGGTYISVWLGYMVNTAVPRLGEVTRSANLARRERMSLSAVLGTVFIERILDLIILAITIVVSLVLLLERPEIIDRYIAPQVEKLLAGLSPQIIAVVIAAVLALLVVSYLAAKRLKRTHQTRGGGPFSRILGLLASFRDGIMTLFRSKRRFAIVVTTVLIWVGYWIMVHIPFELLGLVDTYQLGFGDSFIVLAFGTIGFALFPSPGGTGSYHYVAIATLVYILSMNETDAATYAVVNHAALTLLNVAMGTLCLAIQGTGIGQLQADADAESKLPENPGS